MQAAFPHVERTSEEPLTRRRVEEKFLVAPALAAALAEALATRLPVRRFGSGAESFVTSLYLDRADRSLTAHALDSPSECLKLRAKLYFDAPTAPAGEPARCVVEVKRRRREVSLKQRAWVDRPWLEALCRPGPIVLPRELRLLKRLRVDGPLVPVACVSYRRIVLQQGPELRVTFDRDVRFHPVSAALARADARLAPRDLPPPTGELGRVVVEVKRSGPLPAWLAAAIDGLARESSFSKFIAALSTPPAADQVA